MKKYIILIFLSLSLIFATQSVAQGVNPGSATEALIEGARGVNETSGGYTYVVIIQSSIIVLLVFVSGYLFTVKRIDDKENEEYLRTISKEAITAVIKSEAVLIDIKNGQDRLSNDHDSMKDNISQIKSKVQ